MYSINLIAYPIQKEIALKNFGKKISLIYNSEKQQLLNITTSGLFLFLCWTFPLHLFVTFQNCDTSIVFPLLFVGFLNQIKPPPYLEVPLCEENKCTCSISILNYRIDDS